MPTVLSVRIDSESRIWRELDARSGDDPRGGRGEAAREVMERYFDLLRSRVGFLDEMFSDDELATIAAALSGTYIQASLCPHIASEIAEYLSDDDAGRDSAGLVRRLRDLDPAALYALTDMVERYQKARRRGEETTLRETLRRGRARGETR